MIARAIGLWLLLALIACGRTSGPIEIPPEDLPFQVARTPPEVESTIPARAFIVYFVRDGRLARVRREIRTDASPAEAGLRALLVGPQQLERERRIVTQLAAAVRLLDLRIETDVAHVDLSGEFQEPGSPEVIALRVAQVVYTLTEFPEVRAVKFSIDGEEIAVTTVEGTTIDRPAMRADYAALSPP